MMPRLALVIVIPVVAVAAAPDPGVPAPKTSHAVGWYDDALRRVVIAGGDGRPRAGVRDSVWSWSGARWEPVTGDGPEARGNAFAAYDPRRRLAVFTGGARRAAADTTRGEIVAESWVGDARGWRRMEGADVDARDHQAMLFDEARGTVLLFGGIRADRGDPWPSDTWELGAGGWTRIAAEGPEGRGRTAMAYDRRRRQVVLFGGAGAAPGPGQPQPFFGDTWVWERGAWRKAADAAPDGPRGRYAHGMVYDERAGVVLLYSGAAAHRDAPLADMWRWDGRRWTEIRLTGPTPGFRYQPVMVYDRARGRTVLYGGLNVTTPDTWEWDGRRWTQVAGADTTSRQAPR